MPIDMLGLGESRRDGGRRNLLRCGYLLTHMIQSEDTVLVNEVFESLLSYAVKTQGGAAAGEGGESPALQSPKYVSLLSDAFHACLCHCGSREILSKIITDKGGRLGADEEKSGDEHARWILTLELGSQVMVRVGSSWEKSTVVKINSRTNFVSFEYIDASGELMMVHVDRGSDADAVKPIEASPLKKANKQQGSGNSMSTSLPFKDHDKSCESLLSAGGGGLPPARRH